MACERRRCTSRRFFSAWGAMNHHAADLSMPATDEIVRQASVALAHAAVLETDDGSPSDAGRRNLREFHPGFRHLFGDAEKMLTVGHFAPNVVGPNARGGPQNSKVIEQIGALPDYRAGITVDGVDRDLDGFLGQFLGHLRRAALKQPGRSRNCRIEILGRDHRAIEPLERITHSPKTNPKQWRAR